MQPYIFILANGGPLSTAARRSRDALRVAQTLRLNLGAASAP
jgi:hypothetical protein